jgi:uncharacterized protein
MHGEPAPASSDQSSCDTGQDAVSERAKRTAACARCGATTPVGSENQWRPFCSERCKLIDLGNWASERYSVPDAGRPGPKQEPDQT